MSAKQRRVVRKEVEALLRQGDVTVYDVIREFNCPYYNAWCALDRLHRDTAVHIAAWTTHPRGKIIPLYRLGKGVSAVRPVSLTQAESRRKSITVRGWGNTPEAIDKALQQRLARLARDLDQQMAPLLANVAAMEAQLVKVRRWCDRLKKQHRREEERIAAVAQRAKAVLTKERGLVPPKAAPHPVLAFPGGRPADVLSLAGQIAGLSK